VRITNGTDVIADGDLRPATGEASDRIATAMKFELSTGEFVEISLADFNIVIEEAKHWLVIKREPDDKGESA